MGFPSRRIEASVPLLATLVGRAGPGPSYRHVVDTAPRFGIHVPDSVRAGPYRLAFDKDAMHRSYDPWHGPGKPAPLSIDLPATVVRPQGDAARLRFATFRSDPQEIRLSLTLTKTRRRYPFEIPVRLDWIR